MVPSMFPYIYGIFRCLIMALRGLSLTLHTFGTNSHGHVRFLEMIIGNDNRNSHAFQIDRADIWCHLTRAISRRNGRLRLKLIVRNLFGRCGVYMLGLVQPQTSSMALTTAEHLRLSKVRGRHSISAGVVHMCKKGQETVERNALGASGVASHSRISPGLVSLR